MSKRIFISYESKEVASAVRFRDILLKIAPEKNKEDFFMACDWRSIRSGEYWFKSLVDALKDGAGLFVLITSVEAFRNPWINFEMGVAIGAHQLPKIFVFGGIPKPKDCPSDPLQWINTGDVDRLEGELKQALGVAELDRSILLGELADLFKQSERFR